MSELIEGGVVLVTLNAKKGIGKRQRTIKGREMSVGPVTMRFVTIFVLALLTLIYLVQSTKGSSEQAKISNLEEQKAKLSDEKQQIEVESIRLRALQNLKNTTNNFNLTPITNSENLDKAE